MGLTQLKSEIKMAKKDPNAVTDKDAWVVRGIGRVKVRKHSAGHRRMFTPLNERIGPTSSSEVGPMRTTIGKFDDGGNFTRTNKWMEVQCPNRQLQKAHRANVGSNL